MRNLAFWVCSVLILGTQILCSPAGANAQPPKLGPENSRDYWSLWDGSVAIPGKVAMPSLPPPRFVTCVVEGNIEECSIRVHKDRKTNTRGFTKYRIRVTNVISGKCGDTLEVYTKATVAVKGDRTGFSCLPNVPYDAFLPANGPVLLVVVRWPWLLDSGKTAGPEPALYGKNWFGAAYIPIGESGDLAIATDYDFSQMTPDVVASGVLTKETMVPHLVPIEISLKEMVAQLKKLYGE